jgi:hypothetical protein
MVYQVRPGDLRDFAQRMGVIAEAWNDPDCSAVQFVKAKDENPDSYAFFGDFQSATQLQSRYDSGWQQMAAVPGKIYELLRGLQDAAERLAEKYADVEDASRDEVGRILTEELEAPPPEGTDGSGQPQV